MEHRLTSSNPLNFGDLQRGTFVSDLHLFSPRSVATGIQNDLARHQAAHECIVLGGDIFDFRWSTQGSHEATLAAANLWLTQLLAQTGQSSVIFLPGNHDCDPIFLKQLSSLAERDPRFSWFDHHVQIKNSLFFHGDILDGGGSLERLEIYRRKFHHVEPQSQFSHRSYDLAVAMRFHKLIPKIRHIPHRTCGQILKMIECFDSVNSSSVKNIYFGHTHVPINGIEVGGIRFFNPGAALRHMNPRLHQFQLNENIAVGVDAHD